MSLSFALPLSKEVGFHFLEVWGLLAFRICSVGFVPHSDEFLYICGEGDNLPILLLCHLEDLPEDLVLVSKKMLTTELKSSDQQFNFPFSISPPLSLSIFPKGKN